MKKFKVRTIIILLFLLSMRMLTAEVLSVEIVNRDTILNGKNWGPVGAYELLSGTILFGTDPTLPQNQKISDLHYAPVNQDGLVHSYADFVVLKPVNAGQSRLALLEISNRGGKFSPSFFLNASGALDPQSLASFGDGWLLNQGVTMIWCGWQFDLPEQEELLRFFAPAVTYPDGTPIVGRVRSDWTVDEWTTTLGLGHRQQRGYAAYAPSSELHVLTRRKGREAPREIIDRRNWDFGKYENGIVLPDLRHIYSKQGFEAGWIYELVYYSDQAVVTGLGLAAIRDLASFVKYDKECPFPVELVIGAGVSQTGRFLRHFLYQGFNEDASGRKVFDGMMIVTAGAGRGSFNHRYAQPSRDAHRYSAFLYPTDIFPFASRATSQEQNGQAEGLMAHLPALTVPKIFQINTGYEYWGRAASLIHTYPDGSRDLEPMPNERIYHIASAQHYVENIPTIENDQAIYTGHSLDFRPNLRALFLALKEWIVSGTTPPESQYPKIAEGNLVNPTQVSYPLIPRFTQSRQPHVALRLDFGPAWSQGQIQYEPPLVKGTFTTLVPQVDQWGNEASGIRNPEIGVPLGTYIPYSLRTGKSGGEGELNDFRGTFIPFSGEYPTGGLSGLYVNKRDYLGKVRAFADSLTSARFLLPQDIHRVVSRSGRLWNWLHSNNDIHALVDPFKVMSYNIRYDNAGDGDSRWEKRKMMVTGLIREEAPDFFGLQEALYHQCEEVEENTNDYRWIGVGRDDGKKKGELSPIFYRYKSWKLLDWGTFWLSDTPENPSRGWDAALPRIVTWAKFRDKRNGKILFVLNTHFDHRGDQARVESAKLIRRKIREIAGNSPFVLTGDFNVSPSTNAYLSLTEIDPAQVPVWDCKSLSSLNPEGPSGTFSGFIVTDQLPLEQIDYIFCSGHFQVKNFRTLVKSENGRYASDHFAVVSEIGH